jgi:hypothetical protein
VIDKWGRGRYWQWICWLPRANREAKPRSSGYNFSCAKFFISAEREEREFQAGLQIERAPLGTGRGPVREVCAADDWDYYRLLAGLKQGSPLAKQIERLVVKEGFTATAGAFGDMKVFRKRTWAGLSAIRSACRRMSEDEWGGFQLYYPLGEKELDTMDGGEIVAATLAIFDEVTPAMNLVMQEPYLNEAFKVKSVKAL